MHTNDGQCLGCAKIFNRYDGFYQPLKDWFFAKQTANHTFHISCAGRGKIDQEACFSRGASKAHWLESAHNWNMAIDCFFQIDGQYRVDHDLFAEIMSDLDDFLDWYGSPGHSFPETPHVEVKEWAQLKQNPVE